MLSCRRLRERGGWAEDVSNKRCTLPIGPRNTVSNLAYLAAGVWVVTTQVVPVRWVLGAALLLLAMGSALYHATKRTWANNLDWAGMFATMSVLVVHGLFPRAPGLALGALSVSMVVTVIYAWDKHFDLMMGGLFLAAALPAMLHGALGPVLVSVGWFLVGYLGWQCDKRRVLLGKWGHAVWHVATAIALERLFLAQVLSVAG